MTKQWPGKDDMQFVEVEKYRDVVDGPKRLGEKHLA